ncbi:hypothetical protein APHAL10511_000792 [Amanita phalloides]|nr:hypothetical protein APHAL10511_000792 [Amanita phalloides]
MCLPVDSVVMLFVFAYVVRALPHVPRLEARGDDVLYKKLSKRVVWRGEIPWTTHSFWHTPVDLGCLDLKPAWERRAKVSTGGGHTDENFSQHSYETTFRHHSAIIKEIIFEDYQAAQNYVTSFRDRTYIGKIAFGSARDSDGRMKFFYIAKPVGVESELHKWLCVQHWEVHDY